MGIKTFKPVTPSLRNTTMLTNEEITKKSPELLFGMQIFFIRLKSITL